MAEKMFSVTPISPYKVYVTRIPYTVFGKYLVEANLTNCELFTKIFLANIHMYVAYALTVAYLPKFSSPLSFTCTVCPAKYFPCSIGIV